MAQVVVTGPIEISPELALAMWASLPPESQTAYAQLYFANYTRPLGDTVLAAGAKAFFEKAEIPKAAEKAIRDGVTAKAKEIGGQIKPEQAQAVIYEELRKAAGDVAKGKIDSIFAALDPRKLADSMLPALSQDVGKLANRYFNATQEGQQKMLKMIADVVEEETKALHQEVRKELRKTAKPVIARNMAAIPMAPDDNGTLTTP